MCHFGRGPKVVPGTEFSVDTESTTCCEESASWVTCASIMKTHSGVCWETWE